MATERYRMAAEPTRENAPNTGTLFLRVYQAFEQELLEGLARAGYRIRAKHGAVLANVDADGTRLTVLARRAGIGKPAMGELVDELETMGHVERVADPLDARAKLVVPTSTGLAAIEAASRVIEGIEARYVAQLGDTRYRRLRSALLSLVPHTAADVQPRTLTAADSNLRPPARQAAHDLAPRRRRYRRDV